MILIDRDRVSFESLGVTEKALELGLLKPLENVPTKNAGDYKGVEVDVDCKENQEALVDVCDYGIKSVAYYREQAEDMVKSQLVIDKIITTEGIKATEEEIEARLKDMAEKQGKKVPDVKKAMGSRQIEYIENDIVIKKLFDVLKSGNVIE